MTVCVFGEQGQQWCDVTYVASRACQSPAVKAQMPINCY
ncbi:hypothetical protein C361_06062 [Cryptococcus neoformans Tu259-1]|uniref:Uncharacterized protein n=1 Tax=Cryptococcus neoformans Tu259-1 TaxID=1230072 RepID=A0A854Q6M1_CRYNE|nr:hypothetical protein C361_06062 [Cryptococcus neoformans var. grubii Tu259-1]